MKNKKIETLDAVQSLVTTAIKWINLEFVNPVPGVEEQATKEILNALNKTDIALSNLTRYINQVYYNDTPWKSS